MKCPKCIEEGKRSKVFDLGRSTTLMACPSYYDEDGNHHTHDSNRISSCFECSEGHKWKVVRDGTECWCGWNKDPKEEILFW